MMGLATLHFTSQLYWQNRLTDVNLAANLQIFLESKMFGVLELCKSLQVYRYSLKPN